MFFVHVLQRLSVWSDVCLCDSRRVAPVHHHIKEAYLVIWFGRIQFEISGILSWKTANGHKVIDSHGSKSYSAHVSEDVMVLT